MTKSAEKKLFLLDALALIYRAYYGLGDNFLYNSKGMNTTAISVFTDSLMKMLREQKPTHIAVAFDTFAPTQRDAVYAEYKANRQAIPEDIKKSIPYIKEILKAMRIPILEYDGYEADDVIGTIAKKAEKDGYQVYMVTPDKDFGQLVSENIKIYKMPFRGKPEEVYGVDEIKKKWEIENVDQVRDILGLMGDSVDNIPGIPGVGEKTAIKLVKEFGTIENLLAHTDKIPGKMREKIEHNAEMARLSKQLATIVTDLPIDVHEENFALSEPDRKKLSEIFAELEFRNLGKRILGEEYSVNIRADQFAKSADGKPDSEKAPQGRNISNTEHRYHLVEGQTQLHQLIEKLKQQDAFSFQLESNSGTGELSGIAFSFAPHEGYFVPLGSEIPAEIKNVLTDERIMKVGHDLKAGMIALKNAGIALRGNLFDTLLAHYVLDGDARHRLDLLSENYLGYSLIGTVNGDSGNRKKTQELFPDMEAIKDKAVEAADIAMQLKARFEPLLKECNGEKLFYEVEIPLIRVLADMEIEGVGIDLPFLKEFSVKMQKDIAELRESIYNEAGTQFNLESPKQLGEVLFDKMKIPYEGKKTATGQYATGEEVLSLLQKEFPIAKKILEYRGLVKLKSTYVDALPQHVNPKTHRIHTSMNQAVAATGRLSSANPNLQNIPIKTERGSEIRRAFIARDSEHVILSADYSQIELRIIAALSHDEGLLQAFNEGLDIHTATAARVYNVPLNLVSREMRSNAKMVNFGLMYGMSAFGLAQRTGMARKEAGEIIKQYFTQFPGIKRFMDESIAKARTLGYAETIMGRRRYLPDINSKNFTVRGFAERNAINMPIQGSAADMIKIAMIKVHREFENKNLQSKMILQIHDELLFDVKKDELDVVKPIVEHCMKTALKLDVPIVVEMGVGRNWLEAH
ncbi:MAG TPA: DNA polymerase I [Chitinophagales bacterium]|nr:DNA polymerase I [Chitinophagales bacterium]